MSTSDDDDLKTAIAMSLEASQSESTAEAPRSTSAGDVSTLNQAKPSAGSGLLGLDRKAMEQERLARHARKRERSISPPPTAHSRKAPKVEAETVTFSSGAMLRSFSTTVQQDQRGRKSEAANVVNERLKRSPSPIPVKSEPVEETTSSSSAPSRAVKYPRGVVKKTWAFRHDRTGDDVKLEEVLEPHTLKTAVLSAFQWDTNWVLAKLRTPIHGGSTKCVFVMQAKEDKLRKEMLEQTADWRVFMRLCFPSMEGQIHCMHSKLMLLFHPEKLRIAIPTANLLNFDWGETGVMENSVWMIDLPRLPPGGKSEDLDASPFRRELLYYLEKQSIDKDVRDGVLNFDFTGTAGMAFVHTVGGAHYDEDAKRTGLLGLSQAVCELQLRSDDDLEIDFAASSIGSLNDEYLRTFHAAATGGDLVARATHAKALTKAKTDFFKPQKSSALNKPAPPENDIRRKLRIYFPTYDTVASSTAGAAGTICLSRKWYESSTFPRQCFRDYKSARTGLLSHNKILYARGKANASKVSTDERRDIAWTYVGSANMSESAWGKLVYDQKAKKWKINCRNWECGVLLPVAPEVITAHVDASKHPESADKEAGDDSETNSEDENGKMRPARAKGRRQVVGFEVFDDIVKPPCEMPGEEYNGRQPWYFMEQR